MELRHLRCLVALSDEGQFTRAAQRLRIAQPALSQQIRRLEAEVGLALVERTTRSVRLTAAGDVLVAHARRMLREADVALAELDDLRGLRSGHLAVGATQTMGAVDLSGLLVEFHRRYPAVELEVEEGISNSLAAALHRDELDLAFITFKGDGLEAFPLASEPLVCIVPPGHALAGRESVDVRALEDELFVVFRRGATIRQLVDEAARAAGFSPRVLFETSNAGRMASLVSQGMGVAVLPASDAARSAGVAVVPLSTPDLTHVVYMCWRANRRHSPAARAFAELALA